MKGHFGAVGRRRRMEEIHMKNNRNILMTLAMGVAMSIVWCAAFVSMMDTPAGIGAGVALGAVFALLCRLVFK